MLVAVAVAVVVVIVVVVVVVVPLLLLLLLLQLLQCDGKRGSIFGKNARINLAISGGKIDTKLAQEPLAPLDLAPL